MRDLCKINDQFISMRESKSEQRFTLPIEQMVDLECFLSRCSLGLVCLAEQGKLNFSKLQTIYLSTLGLRVPTNLIRVRRYYIGDSDVLDIPDSEPVNLEIKERGLGGKIAQKKRIPIKWGQLFTQEGQAILPEDSKREMNGESLLPMAAMQTSRRYYSNSGHIEGDYVTVDSDFYYWGFTYPGRNIHPLGQSNDLIRIEVKQREADALQIGVLAAGLIKLGATPQDPGFLERILQTRYAKYLL